MPKAPRANSKKASSSTRAAAAPPPASTSSSSEPLFQVDTLGSSSVRAQLLSDQQPAQARLRKGQSFKKPLRSDLILAQRSSVPALSSKVTPSLDAQQKKVKHKLGKVDRETKEKLKRLAGKDGQGQGLWGIKTGDQGEAVETVKDAGRYDAWEQEVKAQREDGDVAMQETLDLNDPLRKPAPKAPATLRTHQLITSTSGPRSISLPHPGSSYNPAHADHQALLSSALVHHTAAEVRETRGLELKEQMDAQRALARGQGGTEAWEAYEDEVGSGESDDEANIVDLDVAASKEREKRRAAKRKTKQQRNTKIRVRDEDRELALRREMKKRVASVQHVKEVDAEVLAAASLSLEEKALVLKARKARLVEQGLTRFRSGPSRVPDAPVTFQLGDELAENLRTLTPEGNLWKEWVGSGMRRGRVPVERANEGKKGGKRGGRGRDKGSKLKEVEKFAWKRFE